MLIHFKWDAKGPFNKQHYFFSYYKATKNLNISVKHDSL